MFSAARSHLPLRDTQIGESWFKQSHCSSTSLPLSEVNDELKCNVANVLAHQSEYEQKFAGDMDVLASFGGWFQPRFKVLQDIVTYTSDGTSKNKFLKFRYTWQGHCWLQYAQSRHPKACPWQALLIQPNKWKWTLIIIPGTLSSIQLLFKFVLYSWVQLTISQHQGDDSAPNTLPDITWTHGDQYHRLIYMSPSPNKPINRYGEGHMLICAILLHRSLIHITECRFVLVKWNRFSFSKI